jgi:peptidylprolyl isomerase
MVGIGLAWGAFGCSKSPGPDAPKPQPTANGSPTEAPSEGSRGDFSNINFSQRFEEAVITDVLEGQHLPPEATIAGVKTAPLRVAVEKTWPNIKLTDSTGSPIKYTWNLDTEAGRIEIALRPEFAPNHVRNVLALAHAGYYDGLVFERTLHAEVVSDTASSRLDFIMAGCPTGTGDDGHGHIGYFMRSEFRKDLKHEAGTVGVWHEDDPDSAGCRFYITLGPAPILDGRYTIVGKVTQGLDVVRQIAEGPVQDPASSPENEKPAKPVVIKKATISPQLMEKAASTGHNE